MIKLYPQNETQFLSNGTVLIDCLSCLITEESNGPFYAEYTFPLSNKILDEQMIITADTHRGEQKFRIIKIKKTYVKGRKVKYVYARHIFYDLLDNYLRDVRPTKLTAINFIQHLLNGTQFAHPFTGTAEDISGTATANYIRRNPIDALMGDTSNSMLSLFGGDLERSNFSVKLKGGNRDRGFKVALGKNLTGIEEDLDYSSVITRVQPTAVLDNNVVTELAEIYVDSPLIGNYHSPKIQEYRVELSDEEKLLPLADIHSLMRTRAQEKFSKDKVDLPLINFKVDFVQIEKTVQYESIAILTELNLNDTCTVDCSSLNVNLKAKLIKVVYNGLRKRYEKLELGDFRKSLLNQKKDTLTIIEKIVSQSVDGEITAKLKDALDKITGNTGGYMKILYNAEGLPQGTLYMDTPDASTAQNYILINNQGIAFGNTGLSNPPELALNIDGTIAGDSAFFRSLTTNLIQSDVGQQLNIESNEAIQARVTRQQLISDPEIKNSITQAVTPAVVTSVRQSQDYQNDLAEAAKSRDLRLVRNLIESLKVPYEQLTSKAEGVSQTELITTMVNSFVSAFTDLNTLYTTIQADGTITEGEWTQLETAITVYKVALASLEFEITKALYEDFGSLTARMESAETKMTNESIIDTVMKSETFTTALGDVKETTKTEVGTILDGWGVNYTNQLEAFGEVLDPFKSWMRFNASQTTLTIGNSISPFSTEISNSMLAFLESGSIVAYIKSNQMRIQNAVIENSLTVGNHEIFKYDDELTIVSWVGGV